jgi:hypothetical protein
MFLVKFGPTTFTFKGGWGSEWGPEWFGTTVTRGGHVVRDLDELVAFADDAGRRGSFVHYHATRGRDNAGDAVITGIVVGFT